MISLKPKEILIPLTVPLKKHKIFIKNYLKATKNTGRLFLFAGDQKIEHLNKDFYGKGISTQDATPKHMFEIANKGRIGTFATQLGLIARQEINYKNINYVVKLNSKTDIIPPQQKDPKGALLTTIEQVVNFATNSKLSIVGVGYTIYLGSEFESEMLSQAAQTIYKAHQNGFLAILWIYPRGNAVKNPYSAEMIAGATGLGTCLGADFIKVNPPDAPSNIDSAKHLKQATQAAGTSGVICSGGPMETDKNLLERLYHQIHTGGTVGTAIGRNLHQRDLHKAVKLSNAIASIIFDDTSIKKAQTFL